MRELSVPVQKPTCFAAEAQQDEQLRQGAAAEEWEITKSRSSRVNERKSKIMT
jgi:hypothetical protein